MLSHKILHNEFDPPEELQDVIKCFWYEKRNPEKEQLSLEVLPDGYAEIIFYFGGELSISYNGDFQILSSPFIIGLLNQPFTIKADKGLEIIGIRCFPWAVFDLLGLPSGKLGLQIFEHPIGKLQMVLNEWIEANKIDEAINVVKECFLNFKSQISSDSMLYKAGPAMRESGGTLPVSQVANAAHATIRTLERNFKQSSGYTVKDVSGLMRFEQVRNQLLLNPDLNISALAHELGYTDQSHLSREFRRYSGTTPAAFARKTKKEISNIDFVAFIQS